MPEVDYVVLSEWFDWIVRNIDVSVDLIGERPLSLPRAPGKMCLVGLPACRDSGQGPTTGDPFPHVNPFPLPPLQGQAGSGGFKCLLVFILQAALPGSIVI